MAVPTSDASSAATFLTSDGETSILSSAAMRIGPLGRRADGTMGAVMGAARSNRGDGGIEGGAFGLASSDDL